MKRELLIGIVAGLLAGAAIAQGQAYAVGADGKMQQERTIAPENQASSEQLAKLFEVMRIKQQVQSMRQIVPSMVHQQIQQAMKQTEEGLPSGTKLTAAQRERMQQIMTKYVGKAMDLYPADEMMTDMSGIYQRHLSKDDVDGLITFYPSPPGQHLLDAQPHIAQEFMPIVMEKVAARSQVMAKEMSKEMAEVAPTAKAAPKSGAARSTTKPQPKQ